MAITSGNWASATDPFILATAHSHVSVVDNLWSVKHIKLVDSHGYIGGFISDKDIQEIYWKNEDNEQEILNADSAGYLLSHDEGWREFGKMHKFSSSVAPTYCQPIIQGGPIDFTIWFAGVTSYIPRDNWSLFAYTAYAWEEKDPAQLLFSWLSYYIKSEFTLKDFLDQTSFQDASLYYDVNECPLSCWREVGLSISDQIKKVMDHTSDFLVIAPQDTTGDVLMSIKTRRGSVTSRDYVIDLESESVSKFTIRPTDRYTIDKLTAAYGPVYSPPNWNGFPSGTLVMPPVEYFNQERTRAIQKVGELDDDRNLDLELYYQASRANVCSHVDIGFWKDPQDELEIEFADPSHLNFESGDIVPVTGRGYDGTEKFLVTEKIVDWDTMLASCRLLMLRGIAGSSPRETSTANLILSLRPNSIGYFFDGSSSFPLDAPDPDQTRNFNRIWDESGAHAHPTIHTRGTLTPPGNPPEQWPLSDNKRNRWPGFTLTTGYGGLEISYDINDGRDALVSSLNNYTFYWVGNISSVSGTHYLFDSDDGGSNHLIFSACGGGTAGKVQFYDGSWHGTQNSVTGWQVLVFVCSFTGLSKIRRNGVDLDTGMAYSVKELSDSDNVSLACNAAGTAAGFNGHWMECHLFKGAHNDTLIERIESHLAERYGITI
jgi:hypothetical protein